LRREECREEERRAAETVSRGVPMRHLLADRLVVCVLEAAVDLPVEVRSG